MEAAPPVKVQKHAHEHEHEPPKAANKPAFDDLAEHIDFGKCSVLNAADAGALKEVLCGVKQEGQSATSIKSDCDEQLLFGVVFAQPVRLQSIGFSAPSAMPRTVKLFANKDNMAFDDVEGLAPTQVVTVAGGGTQIPLQFVKFQNVNSITVFVEDNQDDEDVTCVERLKFVGDALHKTNMNDLKKCG